MSRVVVLDAEPVSLLARESGSGWEIARSAVEAADRQGRQVVVPAVVLAELYRGPRHNQVVDSFLGREPGIEVRDTDRSLARYVGGVLAAAGAGSADLADAHVVAAAVEAGGGVLVTGDPQDLERLAAPYANVQVRSV